MSHRWLIAALLAGTGMAESAETENLPPPPLRVAPDYPVVPANHLKFYLHFAEPMARGEVFRFLRLVEIDTDGRELAEVPEPFREVELWDETFTRLTLWFHPGRQKPGVNLNVDIGPILEPGKRYRLEISGKWRTESGVALGERIDHAFTAGPPDESQPRPERWRVIDGPTPEILTDGLVDPVSVRGSITIQDSAGTPMENVRLVFFTIHGRGAKGIGIRLTAQPAWKPGNYRAVIHPKLEDLAGNSIARPFNLDLEKEPDFKERTTPFVMPFSVK